MYQPTGNTCGPTCLYMVKHYIANAPNDLPFDVDIKFTIKDIEEMCGTDWVVGTPPDRMEKGMKTLNIPYVEHLNPPHPYKLLKSILSDGNLAILRTITRSGIPHWILAHGFTDDTFIIADPAAGPLAYKEASLDEVWSKRQHQFFEIAIPNINLISDGE